MIQTDYTLEGREVLLWCEDINDTEVVNVVQLAKEVRRLILAYQSMHSKKLKLKLHIGN